MIHNVYYCSVLSALFRRFRAKTQLSERPHSAAAASKIEVHVTNVTYIDYIVRPQPLPPLSDKLPLTEVCIAYTIPSYLFPLRHYVNVFYFIEKTV